VIFFSATHIISTTYIFFKKKREEKTSAFKKATSFSTILGTTSLTRKVQKSTLKPITDNNLHLLHCALGDSGESASKC
jgi:hypothetical protein